MKIVALISSYKETDLLSSCLRSAQWCDMRMIFEGETNGENNFSDLGTALQYNIIQYNGVWKSDADKRTTMLDFAKELLDDDPNYWALWLDGDEILLWGEYLHDLCQRAEIETATGGAAIKIVEYDGSVANCFGKLIKLKSVKRYIMSSYEVELENGMTVALPNVPICTAGGIPIGEITSKNDPLLATNRPPLQGEPHLLHRHGLRDPSRSVQRLHDAESESFQTLVKEAGLQGVDVKVVQKSSIGNYGRGEKDNG